MGVLVGPQFGCELLVRCRRVVSARVEGNALQEVGLGPASVSRDVAALLREKVGHVDGLPAVADDVDVPRQLTLRAQLVERREELLLRQIAGRAEDDDGERRRHQAGVVGAVGQVGAGRLELERRRGLRLWRLALYRRAPRRARQLSLERVCALKEIDAPAEALPLAGGVAWGGRHRVDAERGCGVMAATGRSVA